MLTDLQKKNPERPLLKGLSRLSTRADDGNRTRDLLTTNEVRYRLCHISLSTRCILHEVHLFVKNDFGTFRPEKTLPF